MRESSVAFLLVLSLLAAVYSAGSVCNDEKRVLRLLTLLPGPLSPAGFSSVDLTAPAERGYELLKAAEIAVEAVNAKNGSFLQNSCLCLELIPAATEKCATGGGTSALVSFVENIWERLNASRNIVGVLGLTCSAVTALVSPITSPPADEDAESLSFLSVAQVSVGGTSPEFQDTASYPNLYRVVSSTAVYNEAMMQMMREFEWRRISVVRDTVDPQYTGTTENFEEKIKGLEGAQLLLRGEVTDGPGDSVSLTLRNLRDQESRIIYTLVPSSGARELLCAALEMNVIAPGFVWIFHDLMLDDFRVATDSCSVAELMKAVEGAFFLNYELEPPQDERQLVSGQTYNEFREEYRSRTNSSQNLLANAMHDSVWAFALALDSLSLEADQWDNLGLLTEDIKAKLASVTFSGATGQVEFTSRNQSGSTKVSISRVNNGNQNQIATYDSKHKKLKIIRMDFDIPEDSFDHRVVHISRAFPIVTFIFTSILIILATVILVFYLGYWKEPVIKATSPLLSLVIFAGCYLLYAAALFPASREYASGDGFAFLCNAEIWFATLGIQAIFATLMVRLFRIYRIFFFNREHKIGTFWSDYFLLVAIGVFIFVLVCLLTLWSAIHPFSTGEDIDFRSSADPPYYERRLECSGSDASGWIVAMLLYNGLTVIIVLALAISTRKVELDSFKDTKKVSAFVYSTFIVILLFAPLAAIFELTGIEEAAFTFRILAYLSIATICIVSLFLSKIISAIFHLEDPRAKTSSNTTYTSPKTPRSPKTPPAQLAHPSSSVNEDDESPARDQERKPDDRKVSIQWVVHDHDAEEHAVGSFRIFDLTVRDIVEYCNCFDREAHQEPPV